LGHSGKIGPDVAAWLVNSIFFLTGIFIILKARK
jgi:hypothetical protein